MPTPISSPHCTPPTTAARMSLLVQLILGGSLAAVVFFLGFLIWRLAHLPRSEKPAAEQPRPARTASPVPRNVVVALSPLKDQDDPEYRKEITEPAPLVDVPASQPQEKAATVALPAPPKSLTADQIFEQRLQASEDDLHRQLAAVPEVRLLSDEQVRKIRDAQRASQKAVAAAATAQQKAVLKFSRNSHIKIRTPSRKAEVLAETNQIAYATNVRLQQMMKHAALQAGLRLQSGRCQLPWETALEMSQLSKTLRNMGFVTIPGAAPVNQLGIFGSALVPGASRSPAAAAPVPIKTFRTWCDQHRLENYPGTVPTLVQMLQIENEATRLLLVRELTRIRNSSATTQLAGRALMDLSPAVRQDAIAGLQRRPEHRYVPVLLRGLRYPWPPVADHAAVALRTLKPQEAVAPLVDFLDLPSPSAPVREAGTNEYSVRELVRLNHLRNCLLCHAPSLDAEDGIARGLVPTPGEPLPTVPSFTGFGGGGGGNGYYESYDSSKDDFVRADISHLHQDFSVNLLDQFTGAWPPEQRYDFVTRWRTVTPSEMARLPALSDYPQRDAVLYALRGITGKDGGASSHKWREMLGIAKEDKH